MISVIIATYNRKNLVSRAIRSVLDQGEGKWEVIVVDDASGDGTAAYLSEKFKGAIRVLAQPENKGPGPARMAGIQDATGEYCLILDDDDELRGNIYNGIISAIGSVEKKYPVYQFSCRNEAERNGHAVIGIDDYLCGSISGDYTPIIRRALFLESGYKYPDTRIGAEHRLWWRVSADHGIPSFQQNLVQVNADAAVRLTDPRTQVLKATDHARSHAEDVAFLRNHFEGKDDKGRIEKGIFASGVYWIISGDRIQGMGKAFSLLHTGSIVKFLVIFGLALSPGFVARKLFLSYRAWNR